MIEWLKQLDIKLQAGLISSITSISILIIGWIFKIIYERNSLNFKLKKEFNFEQKKKLKEEIAKNKIQLLNAAEELNHRFWNFSQNVHKDWHKIEPKDWFQPSKYYINSFVYRYLVFIHWLIKVEKDTLTVDSTIADSNDIRFLKYVKTLKDIFTDVDMFDGLNYDSSHNTNHFFKNDLIGYSKVVVKDDSVLDFDEFIFKCQSNHDNIKKVVEYFTRIENSNTDRNLNVLKCAHLLIIQFLNTYGHSYQKTTKEKVETITSKYKTELIIQHNFRNFVIKSKLGTEMKPIIKQITKV